MDNKLFYEYLLRYPQGFFVGNVDVSGVVFYVGKGTPYPVWRCIERIDIHEQEARRGCDCGKCQTIRSVWAKGQQIIKEKVFKSSHEHEVLAKEQTDIKITYAGPYLTNYQHNDYLRLASMPETEKQREVKLFVQQAARQIMKEERKKLDKH